MHTYGLYVSGILYGKLKKEAEQVLMQKLDVFTAEFSDWQELTREENTFYKELTKMDLLHFFTNEERYKIYLKEQGEVVLARDEQGCVKISDGNTAQGSAGVERYTSVDGEHFLQRDIKFPNNKLVKNGEVIALYCSAREITNVLVREGMEDETVLKRWKETWPSEPIYAVKKLNGEVIALYCSAREITNVLVREGMEDETVLKRWKETWPSEPIYAVKKLGTFMAQMRDGICLSADVYLPENNGKKVPAVLVRTPYGKEDGCESYYRYVQRGYAVVIQDVRGRNESEGEWMPNFHEVEDGDDTLNWIAAQPWSDGNVGMVGGSYLGYVQWAAAASGWMPNFHEVEDGDDTLNWIAAQPWSDGNVGMVGGSYLGYVQWAAAASGNPHLKALISVVCAGSAFRDTPRQGGSMSSGTLAWAFSVSQKKFEAQRMVRDDWDEVLNIRPLTDIPRRALGYEVPFLTKWLETSDYNEFWKQSSWLERSKGTVVPALIQSGWFDDNGMGTSEALELTQDYPKGSKKVILGPWQHSGNSRYDMHHVSFGPEAIRFDLDYLYFKWFEYYLKGIKNDVVDGPTIEYYTVGQERWKTAENWPVPETVVKELYLDSRGNANTSAGDGVLVWEKPETDGCDTYVYNPEDPATHIIDMSENEISVPEDYTEEEKRADVLCYTTKPLTEDIVITGDMQVQLYISSDAPDTDFMVRVTDVDEKGRSIKLADGFLSARYHNGFEKSEFLEPGQIVGLNITTTKISNCFRKGHRIRFTVTSGAKNFVFPNSNTREGYNSTETVIANNCVHHGGAYASRILVRLES